MKNKIINLHTKPGIMEKYRLFRIDRLASQDIARYYGSLSDPSPLLTDRALERCADHKIPELYKLIIDPNEKVITRAIELCAVSMIPELYKLIKTPSVAVTKIAVSRCDIYKKICLFPQIDKAIISDPEIKSSLKL